MRIEQLAYLVKVCDTKSFTAASKQLHISQPTISQAISALESELGVSLLERTRSMGVVPTPIGELVIDHARKICEEVDMIISASSNTSKLPRSIVIVSTPTINAVILTQCILSFNQRQRGISSNRFHLLENLASTAEKLVANGDADFAVVPVIPDGNAPKDPSLVFRKLMSAEIMAILHRDNPLSKCDSLDFKTIQKHPVSMFNSEYVVYEPIYSRISKYGPPNIVFESGSTELTREIARSYVDLIAFAYDINIFHQDRASMVINPDIVLVPIKDTVSTDIGILYKKTTDCRPLQKSL